MATARSRSLAILPPLLIVGVAGRGLAGLREPQRGRRRRAARAQPRALGGLGQPRRPLGQHAADAARDLLGFALSLAVGLVLAVLVDSSAASAPRADAGARGDADAPDRRDRAADDHLVRLRSHAQGAAGRARHVLPDHGGVRRGLRGQRARGRGAAALDGREPGAQSSARSGSRASLPFFFAGLRIAITYAVVGRDLRGVRRRRARGSASTCRTRRTPSAPTSCWPPSLVSALLTLVLFALTYAVERVAIPWYRLSRQGGRRG